MILPESIQINYDITESTVYPSQTYVLDFETGVVSSSVDYQEAVKQAILKMLLTDRYAYEIYDGYYGNELFTLIGQSYDYVIVEAPRIIKDTLLKDDRILGVGGFKYRQASVDSVEIEFQVDTIYGSIDINSRVVM